MSQSVKQPIGQKRLTNVALVRYKKKGKRFEIAAYKNKVVNWRNGVEKDLDEVLQTTTVFQNVSKGILAKHEDLVDVFGTADEEKICLLILADGELQVSDKEREVEFSTLFKDIASIITEKCINPETNRPYTIGMIERALRDVHFSVDPKRSAKQQALEALPELQQRFPIQRARMRLKLQVPVAEETELLKLLEREHAVTEIQSYDGGQMVVTCLIEPGCFRSVHSVVSAPDVRGRVEVISLAAIDDSAAASQFNAHHPAAEHPHPAQPRPAPTSAASASGFATSQSAVPSRRAADAGLADGSAARIGEVVYLQGPVGGIPEEYASRRERFAELDALQAGWQVELRERPDGDTVDAVFYSPTGERVGTFAAARRLALQSHKQAAAQTSAAPPL